MSISPIGNASDYATPLATKPQGQQELTTITTKCKKEHAHNPSCPHSVSTKPAPKIGEKGYLIDKTI